MNKSFMQKISVAVSILMSIVFLFIGVGCIYIALSNISIINVQAALVNGDSHYRITDVEKKMIRLSIKDVPVIFETEQALEVMLPEEIVFHSTPVRGDTIGSLWIPSLEIEVPIIEGTDTEELAKGVGHYIQSVLPGEKDNCILSGHRDTVFIKLGGIHIGDQIIIKTDSGLYIYQVSSTRIVNKNDKTVIVPTETAVLTITTCYPFVFIGAAPDRFIVIADLVISD